MQFSAQYLQNNRTLGAGVPPGKSWIRHCIRSSDEIEFTAKNDRSCLIYLAMIISFPLGNPCIIDYYRCMFEDLYGFHPDCNREFVVYHCKGSRGKTEFIYCTADTPWDPTLEQCAPSKHQGRIYFSFSSQCETSVMRVRLEGRTNTH